MNRLTTTLIVLLLAVLYSAVSPAHDGKVFTHNLYLHRQNVKVLLVTAHPDDECMFFGPTILALRARNVEVHSLCLSVGNQDGLGSTRRHELFDSLDVLDVPAGKREVVDRPDLPDNITLHWDPAVIANVVRPYLGQHHITAIFTFDSHGISGHPNHGSLVVGLSQLLLDWPHDSKKPKPRLFTLTSVSLGSKYIGLLSPLTRRISLPLERLWVRIWRRGRSQPPPLVVISGLKEYLTAHKAMRQHASQLVWFRHLYVLFSRYMWVNDWQEVDVNLGNGKVHKNNNKDNTITDTNKINNVKGGGIMPDSEVEARAEYEDEAAKDVDSQETQAE